MSKLILFNKVKERLITEVPTFKKSKFPKKHVGMFNNQFDNEKRETGIFELLAEIHQALQGFDGEVFTGLSRGPERQDVDHDNVIVWQADYITNLTDTTATDTRKLVNAEVEKLTVEKDLDIDNPVIRTGDGE